eukprot:Gb_14215 [translate_table: standard]
MHAGHYQMPPVSFDTKCICSVNHAGVPWTCVRSGGNVIYSCWAHPLNSLHASYTPGHTLDIICTTAGHIKHTRRYMMGIPGGRGRPGGAQGHPWPSASPPYSNNP